MDETRAPGDSASEFQKLYRFVATHPEGGNDNADKVARLMWQLNVPAELNGFGWITMQLAAWIGCKTGYFAGGKFSRQIELTENRQHKCSLLQLDDEGMAFFNDLRWWIKWYASHFDQINHYMGLAFADGPGEAKDPTSLIKNSSRHPLYVLLFCKLHDENWIDLCLRLLVMHAYALREWGYSKFLEYNGENESSDIRITVGLRARELRTLHDEAAVAFINDLTTEEIWGKDLSLRRKNANNFTNWQLAKEPIRVGNDLVIEGNADSKSQVIVGLLSKLLRFFDSVGKGKSGKFRKKGKIRSKSKSRSKVFPWGRGEVEIDSHRFIRDPGHDADDATPHEDGRLIIEEFLVGADDEEIVDSDLPIDEFLGPNSLILEGTKRDKKSQFKIINPISAKQRQKHISMSAQHFAWQTEMLTFTQIKSLHTYCNECIQKHLDKASYLLSKVEKWELECALLIQVILWTGSNLERALGLRVTSISGIEMAPDSFRLLIRNDNIDDEIIGEFLLFPITPEYKSTPTYDSENCRERVARLHLPDIVSQAKSLKKFHQKFVKNKKSNLIFQPVNKSAEKSTELYRKELKKFIIEFQKIDYFAEGITLNRIENFMFRYLESETKDAALASIITANHYKSAYVRLFYSTYSMEYIQKTYGKATGPIREELKINFDAGYNSEVTGQHIGARFCLERQPICSAIMRLKNDLEEASHYRTLEEFIHFHNLYTLYTVLMYGFSTGARAVKSPVLLFQEFDSNGFSSYADKDSDPPYHARLIWVPAVVLEHLESYSKYFHRVKSWMFLQDQKIPDEVSSFFLKKTRNKIKVDEAKPSVIERHFSTYLSAPANAHRRFLRTSLIEVGVLPELVDAVMGHWGTGEEPWSRWSSFSYKNYVATIEPEINKILQEFGFTAFSFSDGKKI
ncbi:hypothetical protein [Sneathiella aquimaris]|uniref:hypothetical protein n=1 Tax=Sneathiella aquimaris TaxID=2599305 RepID=UPI00146CAB13|nr:hypothetical protein [Sneathiella aquimaris]